VKITELLLALGTNYYLKDVDNNLPIQVAKKNQNPDVIKSLQ